MLNPVLTELIKKIFNNELLNKLGVYQLYNVLLAITTRNDKNVNLFLKTYSNHNDLFQLLAFYKTGQCSNEHITMMSDYLKKNEVNIIINKCIFDKQPHLSEVFTRIVNKGNIHALFETVTNENLVHLLCLGMLGDVKDVHVKMMSDYLKTLKQPSETMKEQPVLKKEPVVFTHAIITPQKKEVYKYIFGKK